jgi:hypothetical protein
MVVDSVERFRLCTERKIKNPYFGTEPPEPGWNELCADAGLVGLETGCRR